MEIQTVAVRNGSAVKQTNAATTALNFLVALNLNVLSRPRFFSTFKCGDGRRRSSVDETVCTNFFHCIFGTEFCPMHQVAAWSDNLDRRRLAHAVVFKKQADSLNFPECSGEMSEGSEQTQYYKTSSRL